MTAADRPDRGFIDTNVVILLDRIDDPRVLPRQPMISAITLAELAVGPLATDDPHEAALRQVRLQEIEAAYEPIPFDDRAARAFAQVSSDLRRSGRKVSARSFDALLAASAISRGVSITTTNPDDFAGIGGLDVRPVPHPERTAD